MVKLPAAKLLLLLLFLPLLAVAVEKGPVVKWKNPRSELQVYYGDDGSSSCCNAVVLLNVGTAMAVEDYSNMATEIVKQAPGVVTIIMDTNPGSLRHFRPGIRKQDGKQYISLANAIAANITELVPCCQEPPNQGYFIGGHSGGGEGAVHALMSGNLSFTVAGFIGLAPFQIIDNPKNRKKMTINVPSLQWGFANTTCYVVREQAAMAAYNISPPSNRVFYNVHSTKECIIPSGPHCSFANRGCKGMCSGQPKYNWIHQAVGHSIQLFTTAVSSGQSFSQELFDLGRSDEMQLLVNRDLLRPGTVSSASAEL